MQRGLDRGHSVGGQRTERVQHHPASHADRGVEGRVDHDEDRDGPAADPGRAPVQIADQ
jgi:hypothetical protein